MDNIVNISKYSIKRKGKTLEELIEVYTGVIPNNSLPYNLNIGQALIRQKFIAFRDSGRNIYISKLINGCTIRAEFYNVQDIIDFIDYYKLSINTDKITLEVLGDDNELDVLTEHANRQIEMLNTYSVLHELENN